MKSNLMKIRIPISINYYLAAAPRSFFTTASLFLLLVAANAQAPPPCLPQPPNLVGWWPGEANADDIVGGNSGTVPGGVTFASGEVGQAFSFDGASYVDASDSSLPVGNSSATISAWISTTQHGEHYFVSWGSRIGCGDPVSNEIALGVFVDNHLILESCGGNIRSSTVVNDGTWHHVAGVWYGSDIAAVYVDGVNVTVNDCSWGCLPSIDIISSGHLNIGQLVDAGYNFSGLVDEVQIFNRALSTSEIQAIFAAGSAGLCKTPTPSCNAQVQPPINPDASSIFNVRRGVVPVKFSLTCDGIPACDLSPAIITVTRTAGGAQGVINESVYTMAADTGSNFRIAGCQYTYNLNSSALGVGTYRVDILINGQVVGSATFQLK